MNTNDILQAITLRCEKEIADTSGIETRGPVLAEEIMVMIDKAGEATKILPRAGAGLARLTRDLPLIILDLESSSADKATAAIIEIAMVKIHPDGTRETFQTLVNPGFDISPEIEELTHITNADLAVALPFQNYGSQIVAFIGDGYLCGFNLRNFDAPLLYECLFRVGYNWNFPQERILDVMEIFHQMEPRSLAGAVRFYLDGDHSNAHRALPDVEATINVLDAQLVRYQGLPDDMDTLIVETKKDNRLDMAGKIIIHNGVPCFNFGKWGPAGGKEPTPCHEQRGYMRWVLEKGEDFTNNSRMVIQAIYDDTRPQGHRD